jgi:enoyl-CoA hydratase/carnithine racemase
MFYKESQIGNFENEQFEFIQTQIKGHQLIITLNRPEKKNAMNSPLMNELAFALAYAKYSKDIWLVILQANGSIFCAGADLSNFLENQKAIRSTIPEPSEPIRLGDAIIQVFKPIIAKVHASVYAGGFLLLGGCTHVVAARDAQFSLPEVKRGIWPFQVMASLERFVPARQLIDWCIRGRTISADEALKFGIVNEVVENELLDETVNKLAEEIESQAPFAIHMGLKAYHEMQTIHSDKKHLYLYNMLQATLQSDDAKEGISAFKEKRKPLWKNK